MTSPAGEHRARTIRRAQESYTESTGEISWAKLTDADRYSRLYDAALEELAIADELIATLCGASLPDGLRIPGVDEFGAFTL